MGAKRSINSPRICPRRGRSGRDRSRDLLFGSGFLRILAGCRRFRSTCICAVPPRGRRVASAAGGQLHQLGAPLRAAAIHPWRLDDHCAPHARRSRLRVRRRWAAVGGRSERTADRRWIWWGEQPSHPVVSRHAATVTTRAVTTVLVVIVVALSLANAA